MLFLERNINRKTIFLMIFSIDAKLIKLLQLTYFNVTFKVSDRFRPLSDSIAELQASVKVLCVTQPEENYRGIKLALAKVPESCGLCRSTLSRRT